MRALTPRQREHLAGTIEHWVYWSDDEHMSVDAARWLAHVVRMLRDDDWPLPLRSYERRRAEPHNEQ